MADGYRIPHIGQLLLKLQSSAEALVLPGAAVRLNR